MSLKVKSSFSSGEIDPALQERTTLARFNSGLNVGRNVVISRSGSVISRQGRRIFVEAKLEDREVIGYMPPRSGYLIEWGHLYVRGYGLDGTLLYDTAHDFDEDDLATIQFETSGVYVYIFCAGKTMKKLNYTTGAFTSSSSIFAIPPAPVSSTPIASTGTGYNVDYLVTYVLRGEESFGLLIPAGATYNLPQTAGETNTIETILGPFAAIPGITESRWYRRPENAGSFGFVGSSSYLYTSGSNLLAQFSDIGQAADYTHQPPIAITPLQVDPILLLSPTGTIYQQRLVITEDTDKEAIYAGRPGFQNNFFREFPITSDSALKFKSGTSGYAQVLRMIDADGLVAFTTAGIFLNSGALTNENLAMVKKGKWIIDSSIPPLAVPGGVFFVDSATNTIRNLVWSTELAGYNAPDISIWSNHLFLKRRITSWAFQEGALPVLWVTFEDGTFASFTYEFEQEMRAWTRHDSEVPVEQVIATGLADLTFFIVRDENKRYFELTLPRYVPVSVLAIDPQADKNASIACFDSMKSYSGKINSLLTGSNQFRLTPVVDGDWSGRINLDCGTSGIFTDPGGGVTSYGTAGVVYRIFDNEDGTSIDLTVISRTDDNNIIVQPSTEYPYTNAYGFDLYATAVAVTGLDHLEGESVGLIIDGYVKASPNNDQEDYPPAFVENGICVFPPGVRGAIIHVGRPVTNDIQTLDIDTIEQKPTVIEDININKLYLKVHRTSAELYLDHKFPKENNVENMQKVSSLPILGGEPDEEYEIIGNRAQPPQTKRYEVTLRGDWKSQGKISIRNVDGLHFEVLSIIADAEVEWRSDR